MKYPQQIDKKPKPLSLIGRRVLISIEFIPYMHMLSPLALALSVLRNPPGMVYTKKIFFYLKKALLARSFHKKFVKNQQIAKVLLNGYEFLLMGQKRNLPNLMEFRKNFNKRFKFNLNFIKQWFIKISQFQQLQVQTKGNKKSFIDLIPKILQNHRKSQIRQCQRIRYFLDKIIQKEQSKEYEKCERIFKNSVIKIRIPWTQNIYKQAEQFGKRLWESYQNGDLDKFDKQKSSQKSNLSSLKSEDKESNLISQSKRQKQSIDQSQIHINHCKKYPNNQQQQKDQIFF